MITKQDCFIFSTNTLIKTEAQNIAAHDEVKKLFDKIGIPYKEVLGSYLGNREHSFVVVGNNHQAIVEKLSKQHSQICYVHVHNDNFSELVYLDGKREKLGYLTQVSAKEAQQYDNYTVVPETGDFYVTK